MKHLHVVAAIMVLENKILCARRGAGKYEYLSHKYEFPGGKVEKGELPKEALARELREELEIEVSAERFTHFLTVEHSYPDFSITLETYILQMQQEKPKNTEHASLDWVPLGKLAELEWAKADEPIIQKLVSSRRFI